VFSGNIDMQLCTSAKLFNDHEVYETIYFNNFYKKLHLDGVSNEERDIIRLLILNYASKRIAKNLNIRVNTVDTHRRNILKKLNISSIGKLFGMLKTNKTLI